MIKIRFERYKNYQRERNYRINFLCVCVLHFQGGGAEPSCSDKMQAAAGKTCLQLPTMQECNQVFSQGSWKILAPLSIVVGAFQGARSDPAREETLNAGIHLNMMDSLCACYAHVNILEISGKLFHFSSLNL